jgi:hypothetical protein
MKISKTQKPLKLSQTSNLFGTKRKVVEKGGLVHRDFSPRA